MKGKDRNSVRRGWFFHADGRRGTGFYPLRREPLLDRALELVVGRLTVGTRRCTVRMGAMIAVVARYSRRWDDRWAQRTLRITEGTCTGARAVVRMTVRLTHRRNAGVRVTRAIRDTVRGWHLWMRET